MAQPRHEAAMALLDEVSGWPPVPIEERQTLEEGLRSMHQRYLSTSELQAVARLSYRQLRRLNKRKLMLSDRELVRALMVLKKAPRGP